MKYAEGKSKERHTQNIRYLQPPITLTSEIKKAARKTVR